MKTKVTNEFISQLTREWVATLPYRYPLDRENPHQFSQRFLDRMEPVLQAAREEEQGGRKRRRRAMKTTATLLAAALGATVAMAYMVHYFQMEQIKHEKYSTVDFVQVEEGYIAEKLVPCHIGYIPDGFVLTQKRKTEISYRELYEGNDDLFVFLNQSRIDKIKFSIDTENAEPIEFSLNDSQKAFYIDAGSYRTIYWDSGIYSFCVSGNVDKTTLVKIAKSAIE